MDTSERAVDHLRPPSLKWTRSALSGERTPGFDTILKVVRALGLKLHAEAAPLAN
jgi:hypothetical protein